jgi:hypothetical protein
LVYVGWRNLAHAKIKLQRLVQDSQEYGSDDEHMVSRVFFELEIDGTNYQGLHCDVKQIVGSSIETAPLEVSAPTGYKGPFNHQAFQKIVERYFRGLVGSQGRGIRITGGSNIRMQNNTFVQPSEATFEVQVSGGTW